MFLGVEIGGTKLQLGIGPGDGTIIAQERARVDASLGAAGIRRQIVQCVPRLLDQASVKRADIEATGIGFGGPVDAERGIVTKSHQIEGWAGFALADWCQRELGWPTVVHNDADTAGLAEACFGAGRGLSPIFYITIGSGIGGGLIIDQRIYRGAGSGAAEIGHVRIPNWFDFLLPELRDGRARFQERHDLEAGTRPRFWSPVIESVCSGWAIEQQVRERLKGAAEARERPSASAEIGAGTADLLDRTNGDINAVTMEIITAAARAGNAVAQREFYRLCYRLGWAIAQVVALLCPRRIVIGGGVSFAGADLLFEPLRTEVARNVFEPFATSYDIVPAALGENVVLHGALRLARDRTSSMA